MEKDLPIRDGIAIPGAELRFTASRSGGPGGQHVNTTSSRVTLHWDLAGTTALDPWRRARVMRRLRSRMTRSGEIQIHVEDERSQHRNREIARERLAELIREALRPRKRRVRTRVPAAQRKRRLEHKRRRAETKRRRRRPVDND
jgi:ribosome-associated protein